MAAPQTPLSARSSAQLRLFGTAEGDPGAAPWFKPERLTASDFSADAYVADLRRFVPLESLSQELEAYLGTLRGKVCCDCFACSCRGFVAAAEHC